jgi:hypothetical protein
MRVKLPVEGGLASNLAFLVFLVDFNGSKICERGRSWRATDKRVPWTLVRAEGVGVGMMG